MMGKRLGRGLCLGSVLIFLLKGTGWSASLDGPALYAKECASCHGKDGRGSPEGTGLTVSLPDFTDCSSNSSASTSAWTDIITNGGAFTDLSDQMPSFGEVLSPEEIRTVLTYVRNFCQEAGWPSGDLNFHKTLFTSKAFPENEAVLKQEFIKGKKGTRVWTTTLSHERRLGARGEWELSLPYIVRETRERTAAGPGDLSLEYKHVLSTHTEKRALTAAALEVVFSLRRPRPWSWRWHVRVRALPFERDCAAPVRVPKPDSGGSSAQREPGGPANALSARRKLSDLTLDARCRPQPGGRVPS